MSIERIRKKAPKTPFNVDQFYLVQVNEEYYNFIDRKSLIVISCGPLDSIQVSIRNVLRRYRNYDQLQLNIRGLQFTKYTEQEKKDKQQLLLRKGEQLSYVLDELISEFYKDIESKTSAKKGLVKRTPPTPVLVEDSVKSVIEETTSNKPIKLLPKKRIKRL